MIVPSGLVDAINTLQQNMFINAPTISQTAALQCWDPDTLKVLEAHVTKYRTSRSIILEELQKMPELLAAPADGGFYVVRRIILSCSDISATSRKSLTVFIFHLVFLFST